MWIWGPLLPSSSELLGGTPAGKIVLSLSPYFADGDPTTAQLTQPGNHTFQAGKMGETSNPLPAIDLDTDRYTELEWCIKADENTVDGEVYEFRVTIAGTPLDTYLYTPRWTIGTTGAGLSIIIAMASYRRRRI